MKVSYKGRQVDITIDGAVYDYDYHCDAFITEAYWEDTGTEFTEEELDEINNYMHTGTEWIYDWLY